MSLVLDAFVAQEQQMTVSFIRYRVMFRKYFVKSDIDEIVWEH
jgi:hypothetical protein